MGGETSIDPDSKRICPSTPIHGSKTVTHAVTSEGISALYAHKNGLLNINIVSRTCRVGDTHD